MNHRMYAVSDFIRGAVAAVVATALPTLAAAGVIQDYAFSEELSFADVAVIARLVESTPVVLNDAGEPIERGRTTFDVVHVLKVESGASDPAPTIERRLHFDAPPGTLYMLYAVDSELELSWVTHEPIPEECAAYVLEVAALESTGSDRLRHLIPFMGHSDPVIAADVMREFGLANGDDVITVISDIDSDRLLALALDPNTDPNFVGIYCWMLGLTGATQHATALRELVMTQPESIRAGRDGEMVGYAMLAGLEGWELIEREKLLNSDAPFSETYAALRALRYLLTYPIDTLPRERLLESMRAMLDRPEIADLVVSDLARFEDWSVIDRLNEMYDAEGFQEPAIQRAIIRHFLSAQHAGCQAVEAGGECPDFAERAARYLDVIKRRDPARYEQAMRYFSNADAATSEGDDAHPRHGPIFNPLLHPNGWRC